MLEKLIKVDVELKIANSLSPHDRVQLKIHFMELFTSKEKLTNDIFDDIIKETLKYLHINCKKFINLDDYVYTIGRIPNTNVMTLFDCCREIKFKGKEKDKDLTEE